MYLFSVISLSNTPLYFTQKRAENIASNMARYFEIDNSPTIGKTNSFICFAKGKRGDLQFFNCDVSGKRPLRISNLKDYETPFFLVRVLITGSEMKEKTNFNDRHSQYIADEATLEFVPIPIPKRYPSNEIFVRLKRTGYRSARYGLALNNVHKAVASCLDLGLDMSCFCVEMTKDQFEVAGEEEKEQEEHETEAAYEAYVRERHHDALEKAAECLMQQNAPIQHGDDCLDWLSLGYDSFVVRLKNKYGCVPGDYYLDESCAKRNTSISRGTEGLIVHHCAENRVPSLSESRVARAYPFSYQKSENLVYCDILEHLTLHIKIFALKIRQRFQLYRPLDVGLRLICQQINDCFAGLTPSNRYNQAIKDSLDGRFNTYIALLTYLFWFIMRNTFARREEFVEILSSGFDGRNNQKVLEILTNAYEEFKKEFYNRS